MDLSFLCAQDFTSIFSLHSLQDGASRQSSTDFNLTNAGPKSSESYSSKSTSMGRRDLPIDLHT